MSLPQAPHHQAFSAAPQPTTLPPNKTSEHLMAIFKGAIHEVDRIILGKREQVDLMFVALLAQGHVLLDDTPGMGKTTMARAMAKVLGMDMRRVQFTSDLMPSDIVGVSMPVNVAHAGSAHAGPSSRDTLAMVFQPGPVFSHLLLADEINRASPRTQSALLEAMAEHQVSVDGTTHHLPEPFWVIATQNPVDFSGTFPLPESQMDRFLFRMALGYPDETSEMDLLLGQGGLRNNNQPRAMVTIQDTLAAQRCVDKVHVSEPLARYVHRLVLATRQCQDVLAGLSPRAALSLLSAARAHAWLRERNHVIPEDVQAIFLPASAHRLTTSHHDHKIRQDIALRVLQATPVT